jgi:hypothetical protein
VFLPNMVYGALVMPRTRYRSKVQSIDDSEARKIPGFIKAVKVDDGMGKCTGWVVAVAEKFPAAVKAAQVLTGIEQERTACPSMCTVQLPHRPIPQPYLVPVSLRSSREHAVRLPSSRRTCAAVARIVYLPTR